MATIVKTHGDSAYSPLTSSPSKTTTLSTLTFFSITYVMMFKSYFILLSSKILDKIGEDVLKIPVLLTSVSQLSGPSNRPLKHQGQNVSLNQISC